MASEKFKELILYVAQESEFDPTFGATKLNKILFFCDFLFFRKYGRSISGQRYFKLPFGPAPRSLVPALAELVQEEACLVVERQHFDYPQKRIVLRREPNVEMFTAPEVAMVSHVVRALWKNNAKEVSHLSHHFVGWDDAALEEDIPYETIYLGDPQRFTLTEEEIQYGRQLAQEIGATI